MKSDLIYTNGSRYSKVVVDGVVKDMHRVIWEEAYGPIPDGYDIHHINGDGHDNRLENLVLMTRKEHARLHGALRSRDEDVVDSSDPDAIAARLRHKKYRDSHKQKERERNAAYRATHKTEEAERKSLYYSQHREERLAYNAKWREEHKEHIKAYSKAHAKVYNAEHAEEIKTRKRVHYEANKQDILEQNRQYALEHKDELREYRKQHRLQHIEVYKLRDKLRRAKKHSSDPELITRLEADLRDALLRDKQNS